MSACSAVLLNKPQGLEKDQPWCAPLTPGCPVGLRSLPSLPTPVSCAGSEQSILKIHKITDIKKKTGTTATEKQNNKNKNYNQNKSFMFN